MLAMVLANPGTSCIGQVYLGSVTGEERPGAPRNTVARCQFKFFYSQEAKESLRHRHIAVQIPTIPFKKRSGNA